MSDTLEPARPDLQKTEEEQLEAIIAQMEIVRREIDADQAKYNRLKEQSNALRQDTRKTIASIYEMIEKC